MKRYVARHAPIMERHVQAIWYDASLRPTLLRTICGDDVVVLEPGTWNLGAGPDFRDAVLELGRERRRVAGDVEVHLRPADWSGHGHCGDPAYGNVVAHVTWYYGESPPDLPRGCTSICIGDAFCGRSDFSPYEIDVAAYPYAMLPKTIRPCERILGRNPDLGLALLLEAGHRRLEIKSHRLRMRIMRTGNPEQVFYEELFATFGYAKNSEPFRALAERLPLSDLPSMEEAAREVLNSVAEMEIAKTHKWCRANIRPNNSPTVRMADAAAIFTGGKPKHLGAQLSAAILANVIVPFALARGVLKAPPDWLPPEGVNSVVRLVAFRIFGRDHNPAIYAGNGVLMQGLIQIHRDFCLAAHPGCDRCELVKSLENEVD